jgi:hypothetical protein
MIKTNDADKAAGNLKFLVESGLIANEERRRQIEHYLAKRKPGTGTTLPVSGVPASRQTLPCPIKSSEDMATLVVPSTYIVAITKSPTECEFSLSGAGPPSSKKVECTTVHALAWVPDNVGVTVSERKSETGSGKDCIIDVSG